MAKCSAGPIIDVLINKLFKWINDKINELIEKILSSFDNLFEEIGEMIIIIQEKTGNLIDKIIEKASPIIKLAEYIKKIITKIIEVIQSKSDIKVVIIDITDISSFIINNGIQNLTKPITEFIETFKTGIKETINNEYNKIKSGAIDFYESKKSRFNTEYNKIKDKAVNLPDKLSKLLDDKKKLFLEEYNKGKESIIKKTDIKLGILINTQKIKDSFYNIIKKVKFSIGIEIKKIKETIKDKITDYNKFIMNIYEDIIDFINKCMKFTIDRFVDNKLFVFEQIVVFILDVLTNKYETENLNEDSLMELLKTHFQKKINGCEILCSFLIKNDILPLIQKIREYTKEKLFTINSYYESILNMAKSYLNFFLQDAQIYIEKAFKCLEAFDYFNKYINKVYNKICLYEFFFISELKSFNSFITEITDEINRVKNEEINELSNILEQKIEKEYKRLMELKDDIKDEIKDKFEIVENKVIKKVDNTICETASDIENKLIDIAHNLGENAEKYLQNLYPNDISSKLFNLLKKKKDNLLTNLEVEELNIGINRFCNSNLINKTKNIVDAIDLNKANSIINTISRIKNALKISNKIEFKNNIKSKIREKIMSLYNSKIEPELKKFTEGQCKNLINKILK